MRRIFLLCLASVTLYLLLFGLVLDRPLTLGLLRLEIAEKTQRLAGLSSPKLVILAGSNGPYSHSCTVLGRMLALPCENAGIAVGIGLDDIFARDAKLLHRGDIVYMPMELQQYTLSRAGNRAGADAGMLLRHNRRILSHLPADRILGSVFCCSLADFLESAVEMPIAWAGIVKPAQMLAGEYDAQGDRVDNLAAAVDRELLRHPPRAAPSPKEIAQGYGSLLIRNFVARETARGVTVIGGLPVDFATMHLPASSIRAIALLYTQNGGEFLILPNRSLYPPADFFNSEDHLAQPCQYWHSMLVAKHLGPLLGRPLAAPDAQALAIARSCRNKN